MRVTGFVWAAALTVLMSCGGMGETPVETTRASFLSPKSSDAAVATVLDGQFKVAGPRGYCVDPAASRETATGAFVIMGHCRALEVKGPKARQAAVLTVSIAPNSGPVDEATLDALSSFLTSEKGRATLRRSYGAQDVTVKDIDREEGLLLLRASDGGSNEMSAEYWRAILGLRDGLVTITVAGLNAAPIDSQTGRDLVRQTATQLRKLNAVEGDGIAKTTQTPPHAPETRSRKPLKAWFNRLL